MVHIHDLTYIIDSCNVIMSRDYCHTISYEQFLLMEDLESLGLDSIRLNEFNDFHELRNLISVVKKSFPQEYEKAVPMVIASQSLYAVSCEDRQKMENSYQQPTQLPLLYSFDV